MNYIQIKIGALQYIKMELTLLHSINSSRNMALVNGGHLHVKDMKKFLKKYSPPIQLGQFGPNLAGMFFGRFSFKKLFNLNMSKTLVAMTTKWNFLKNYLNISSSGTTAQI